MSLVSSFSNTDYQHLSMYSIFSPVNNGWTVFVPIQGQSSNLYVGSHPIQLEAAFLLKWVLSLLHHFIPLSTGSLLSAHVHAVITPILSKKTKQNKTKYSLIPMNPSRYHFFRQKFLKIVIYKSLFPYPLFPFSWEQHLAEVALVEVTMASALLNSMVHPSSSSYSFDTHYLFLRSLSLFDFGVNHCFHCPQTSLIVPDSISFASLPSL